MKRFINVVGMIIIVVFAILGLKSILPEGGYVEIDKEIVAVGNVIVKVVPLYGDDVSLYFAAINTIEAKDGIEGAQEFVDAVDSNIRPTVYKDELTAVTAAIRYAENGRAGREYGALSAYAKDTTYRKQAGECAFSVQANWDRYIKGGPCLNQINGGNCSIEHQPQDSGDMHSFIDYQGHVYCPIGVANDNGDNVYWKKNVADVYNGLLEEVREN